MRGNTADDVGLDPARRGAGDAQASVHANAVAIRSVLGQPAVIAAVAVGSDEGVAPSQDIDAPIMLSVKFINAGVLEGIATQLGLQNLRAVPAGAVPAGDFLYELKAPNGERVARFAWTAKQPGAEIVQSVVPFIAVAMAGFALLAAFVLRYMRRTAVTIAAGETRLRHLAMHDPLCGLPNRIYFGERLEAVIAEVRAQQFAGRGVLYRSRPLQGRQRHARPSGRRRADPQRDAAAVRTPCAATIWWRASAATNSR